MTTMTARERINAIARNIGGADEDNIRYAVDDLLRESETYNGWTNRETWNTHLWMTNDEGAYNAAREIIQGRYDSDMDYPEVGAADALREWWDETFGPEDTSGPLQDAWSYAMARTDWRRIVEAFREV